MDACRVSGTLDPSRAAVEAAGCRAGDSVRAAVAGSCVSGNLGAGLRLRGAVAHRLVDNDCRGNGPAGDLHVERCGETGAAPEALEPRTGAYAVVRDAASSE